MNETLPYIMASISLAGLFFAIVYFWRSKKIMIEVQASEKFKLDQLERNMITVKSQVNDMSDGRLRKLEDDVAEIKVNIHWIVEAIKELKADIKGGN